MMQNSNIHSEGLTIRYYHVQEYKVDKSGGVLTKCFNWLRISNHDSKNLHNMVSGDIQYIFGGKLYR